MIDTPQPIQPFEATIRSYADLREALVMRKDTLGLTNALIDDLSGMQPGYTGKLLGAGQVKTMGPMSFDTMLSTLGVQLIMVEDMRAVRRMAARWEKRERPNTAPKLVQSASLRVAKTRAAQREALHLVMQKNGKKGGRKSAAGRMKLPASTRRRVARQAVKARNLKLSPERRSQIAKIAAQARWGKVEE